MARAATLPAEVTVLIDAAIRPGAAAPGSRRIGHARPSWRRLRPSSSPAGSLPETIGEAMRQVRPWAVDVSSGVEDAPGIKSRQRMEAFFEAIDAVQDQKLT